MADGVMTRRCRLSGVKMLLICVHDLIERGWAFLITIGRLR